MASPILETLKWTGNEKLKEREFAQETKSGAVIYSGDAVGFKEFAFKTLIKHKALGRKEDPDVERSIHSSKVLEGLRGDALKLAMDLGEDLLDSPEGVPKLVEALRQQVLPRRRHEAKELFKEGTKPHGFLSRQYGESMESYNRRRKRWYRVLKDIDDSFSVGDELLADYLLEAANLKPMEKKLVLSSIGNEYKLDLIEEALNKQYAEIHLEEKNGHRREQREPGRQPGRPKPNPRKGFRPWSRPSGHSYLADADSSASSEETNDLSTEDDDVAYAAISCTSNADEFDDVVDRLEQDIVCAYAAAKVDFEDASVAEEIAAVVDTEICAFFAREDARKRGVPVARRYHSFRPTSELNLEQRKAKVAQVKAKSKCRACGRLGHWQGDSVCPKQKNLKDRRDKHQRSSGSGGPSSSSSKTTSRCRRLRASVSAP